MKDWYIGYSLNRHGESIYDSKGELICDLPFPSDRVDYLNAKLIVVAPDMLEFLELLCDKHGMLSGGSVLQLLDRKRLSDLINQTKG